MIANCRSLIGNGNRQFSVFVFVFVLVDTLLFNDVQLDGIETYDFEFRSTLFTRHNFALVRVQINVDISITFRASSGRHCLFLPALMKAGRHPIRGEFHYLVSNQINLPASEGICNSLFPVNCWPKLRKSHNKLLVTPGTLGFSERVLNRQAD